MLLAWRTPRASSGAPSACVLRSRSTAARSWAAGSSCFPARLPRPRGRPRSWRGSRSAFSRSRSRSRSHRSREGNRSPAGSARTSSVRSARERVAPAAFGPSAPFGWPAVGTAATQLFWAFVGWEAITPLAQEFRDPARDVRRASLFSVGFVAVIYLSLAAVTIGTRSYGVAGLPSFAQMAEESFGVGAVLVVGIAGGILCFTPLNAYVAGTSRLAYALARAGDLPARLASLNDRHVPQRAILALGASTLAALGLTYVLGLRLAD